MSVVKGGSGISMRDLEYLEVVVRGTLGGGRTSVLEEIGYFLGGCLRLLGRVLGMGDALVGYLAKCRWHFHRADRPLVLRLFNRRIGGVVCPGFGGGNGGFGHDTHPFKGVSGWTADAAVNANRL